MVKGWGELPSSINLKVDSYLDARSSIDFLLGELASHNLLSGPCYEGISSLQPIGKHTVYIKSPKLAT